MKKLNLNEFMPEDAEVEFNGETFILTADLPREITKKFKNQTKEDFVKNDEAVRDMLKQIFYVKNDKKKVNKFIDLKTDLQIGIIMKFYNQYVSEMIDSDLELKKKQN